MAKQHVHNEWFRPVFTKTIWGWVRRDEALIVEILSRPHNTLTRELLEGEYRSIIGTESSRRSCPTCKAKLLPKEFVWSWGEYHNANWRTIAHFCKLCYADNVQSRLIEHRNECGCVFQLIGKGVSLPEWLRLPDNSSCNV